MIVDNVTNTENYWIEGFNFSIPSPMTIDVTSGIIYIYGESFSYPEFSFDIVSDSVFDVIYDVYLVKQPTTGEVVHIDRTAISNGTPAFYQGMDKMQYTLTSFIVPANTTDLNNITISVNRAVKI